MSVTINFYGNSAEIAGDDDPIDFIPSEGVPAEWAPSLIPPGEPEPPVGSVVMIHADNRLEPAMRTTSGWVTPTTWVSEDWPWRDDAEHALYLVHEGTEGE